MNQVEQHCGEHSARAVTLADVDAVIDLINAAALADTGMRDTNRDEKLNEWGLPHFNLETDTLLVLAPDGQPAAFAQLWDVEPHVRQYQWGRVHPDHRSRGLGGYLVDWAEVRARQSIGKAPPATRVSLTAVTVHGVDAARDLFRGRGFSPVRHFFRMLIEMAPDRPPPAPVWPKAISVRPFALGQDDRAVYEVMDEAFRDHWGHVEGETFEEWLHWIEHDPTFESSFCFLAQAEGGRIAGALMARPHWEGDPAIAWIDQIGVLRPWRRKGIGLALLQHCFGEFYRRGRYKVGLGVDGQSLTGATQLYERAGMHVFQRRDAYEKVLRPGRDLSIRSLG